MHVTVVVRLELPIKDTENGFFFFMVETATATACTQDFDLEKEKKVASPTKPILAPNGLRPVHSSEEVDAELDQDRRSRPP